MKSLFTVLPQGSACAAEPHQGAGFLAGRARPILPMTKLQIDYDADDNANYYVNGEKVTRAAYLRAEKQMKDVCPFCGETKENARNPTCLKPECVELYRDEE